MHMQETCARGRRNPIVCWRRFAEISHSKLRASNSKKAVPIRKLWSRSSSARRSITSLTRAQTFLQMQKKRPSSYPCQSEFLTLNHCLGQCLHHSKLLAADQSSAHLLPCPMRQCFGCWSPSTREQVVCSFKTGYTKIGDAWYGS